MKRKATFAAAGLAVLAVVGAAVGLARRTGGGGRFPRVVRVEGGVACMNMSLAGSPWITKPVGDGPTYVLARDGDLLFAEGKESDRGMLLYRESDGASLRLEITGSRLARDGTTVSVEILKAADWSWLEKASETELGKLRLLAIDKSVRDTHAPILKKLAKVNPTLGLMLGSRAGLRLALPLFRPRFLSIMDPLSEADAEEIASHPEIEHLWIMPGKNPQSLAFLDKMTALRKLVLLASVTEKTGPLPEGCRRLSSLRVSLKEMKDLSALKNLTGLRELVLGGSESLKDLSGLASFAALESLDLSSFKGVAEFSVLKDLPKLTRLVLPEDITQDTFESLMHDLPRLRALEFVKCEGVTDLAPLKGLSHLKQLVVLGPKADLAPLREMKSLRFLLLSKKDTSEKYIDVEKLEAALPRCTVASGDPFCLGSGWLLALFPAAAVAGFLVRRRRARDPLPGRCDA